MSKDDEAHTSESAEPIRQTNQSGGVNIHGGTNTFEDVAGRDMLKQATQGLSEEALRELFAPLLHSIQQVPPEKKQMAEEKVEALKEEVLKGKQADDSRMAKLLDGIVDLVPGAVSALVSLFASPILAGISGPVTKFVLDKFSGK